MQRARDFVTRDMIATMILNLGKRQLGCITRLNDSCYLTAPTIVRSRHDQGIKYALMGFQCVLDFFREDFFATAIDAIRASTVDRDGTVILELGLIASQ